MNTTKTTAFRFFFKLVFVWCPCMAINVVSVQHNEWWASPRHYTVDPISPPLVALLSQHIRYCIETFMPFIPPKRFDIFSPDWGMLRRSRFVHIFL